MARWYLYLYQIFWDVRLRFFFWYHLARCVLVIVFFNESGPFGGLLQDRRTLQ